MTPQSLDTINAAEASLTWDIYCRVVDNYGDVGVCWRLARNLVERGQTARLFIDDASALAWMASSSDKRNDQLQVNAWDQPVAQCGDVVLETFGAHLPEQALQALGAAKGEQRKVCWLNLEYLSAEAESEANHGLDSLVCEGPAAGMPKQFFYPGFVRGTGGILRDKAATALANKAPDLTWPPKRMALFTYDSPALDCLIHQATEMGMTIQVAAGRTAAYVRRLMSHGGVDVGNIELLPHCTQQAFDAWLNQQDFLVVRGEDSLTRAILAGKPFLWHIYPQEDGAHRIKLNAFLNWLEAPVDMQTAFNTLNDTRSLRDGAPMLPADIDHWHEWLACVRKARNKLLAQNDLVTQLLAHARKVLA